MIETDLFAANQGYRDSLSTIITKSLEIVVVGGRFHMIPFTNSIITLILIQDVYRCFHHNGSQQMRAHMHIIHMCMRIDLHKHAHDSHPLIVMAYEIHVAET